MESRFRLLKVFSALFKGVAWVALIIGLVGVIVPFLTGRTPELSRGVGFVILGVSALYFCLFLALGEIIRLLLILEERTRKP